MHESHMSQKGDCYLWITGCERPPLNLPTFLDLSETNFQIKFIFDIYRGQLIYYFFAYYRKRSGLLLDFLLCAKNRLMLQVSASEVSWRIKKFLDLRKNKNTFILQVVIFFLVFIRWKLHWKILITKQSMQIKDIDWILPLDSNDDSIGNLLDRAENL